MQVDELQKGCEPELDAREEDHLHLSEIELVLGLLVAIIALATAARRIGIPYPIFMVLGGLVLGFVPGIPRPALPPDLVFLFFLPPLLFVSGYFTSIRDFRANLRPIALLAVGLVLFTTAAVAVVAHGLAGLEWAAAFTLGAIVAPPDAIAATAILQRLGVPRRLVAILEGESLVNDATALVTYRFALAALATGSFSLGEASLRFVVVAAGGVAVGLVVGWLASRLLGRISDTPVSITVKLLVPFAAYLPAEQLGVSGVLATVTAALYMGRHASRFTSSETRIAGEAVWQTMVFVLNGLVFILIGLQLPAILEGLEGRTPATLVGLAVAVSLTVIIARIVWVYPASYIPRWLSPSLRARDPIPSWRVIFLVAWPGMRGIVSLAAALALPVDFPERELAIFLTFSVILATLVGQGLTLPWIIRLLGVAPGRDIEHDEAHARSATAELALARLDDLALEWPGHRELIDQLRGRYEHRARHVEAHHDDPTGAAEQELLEHRKIFREVLDAERQAALEMRDRGAISDEVLRRLERDLDLAELRMEA